MRRRVGGVIDAVNRLGCREMWREDSPIWAHPLYRDRLYRPIEYPQVTGHTPVTEIMRRENLISCDVFSTDRQGHRNACTLIRRPEIHTYKRYGCLEFGVQKKGETMMKKCGKCRYRCYSGWGGMTTLCIDYERAETEEDEIRAAADCRKFKEGTPDCLADKDRIYTPSATGGDYSPSSPWNAPGMSVRDFI